MTDIKNKNVIILESDPFYLIALAKFFINNSCESLTYIEFTTNKKPIVKIVSNKVYEKIRKIANFKIKAVEIFVPKLKVSTNVQSFEENFKHLYRNSNSELLNGGYHFHYNDSNESITLNLIFKELFNKLSVPYSRSYIDNSEGEFKIISNDQFVSGHLYNYF